MANDEGKRDWEKPTGKYNHGQFQPDWVGLDSDYHRDPARRTAIALEYIAWVLGQINQKMTPALEQKSEAFSYPSCPIP